MEDECLFSRRRPPLEVRGMKCYDLPNPCSMKHLKICPAFFQSRRARSAAPARSRTMYSSTGIISAPLARPRSAGSLPTFRRGCGVTVAPRGFSSGTKTVRCAVAPLFFRAGRPEVENHYGTGTTVIIHLPENFTFHLMMKSSGGWKITMVPVPS